MFLIEISLFGIIISSVVNKQALGDDSLKVAARIFNGNDVKFGKRPYQVSLQNKYPFCGGSIISNRYILTAAHCLERQIKASNIRIVVGTVNLKKPYKTYFGKRMIIHRNYSKKDNYKNDIALIEVSRPITFSNRVRPVVLPKPGLRIKAGSPVIVSGWGRIENGSVANILQEVVLQVTSQQKCREALANAGDNLYDSQLCADDNDPSVRSGQCRGDSGGPLTAINEVLVGIVSWSIKDPWCGSNEYPSVYTRVADYIYWIRNNMI